MLSLWAIIYTSPPAGMGPGQAQADIFHLSYVILALHLHTGSGHTSFNGEKEPFWISAAHAFFSLFPLVRFSHLLNSPFCSFSASRIPGAANWVSLSAHAGWSAACLCFTWGCGARSEALRFWMDPLDLLGKGGFLSYSCSSGRLLIAQKLHGDYGNGLSSTFRSGKDLFDPQVAL